MRDNSSRSLIDEADRKTPSQSRRTIDEDQNIMWVCLGEYISCRGRISHDFLVVRWLADKER